MWVILKFFLCLYCSCIAPLMVSRMCPARGTYKTVYAYKPIHCYCYRRNSKTRCSNYDHFISAILFFNSLSLIISYLFGTWRRRSFICTKALKRAIDKAIMYIQKCKKKHGNAWQDIEMACAFAQNNPL